VKNAINYFSKIRHLGISDEIDYFDKINLKLLNDQALIVSILNLFFGVGAIGKPDFFIAITFLVFSLAILIFNGIKRFVLAKFLWSIVFPTALLYVFLVYGNELRIDYTYFHFILSTLILINSTKSKIAIVIYLFILYLLGLYISNNFINIYAPYVYPYDKTYVFIAALCCTVDMVLVVYNGFKAHFFMLQNKKQQLEEKNKMLEANANLLLKSNNKLKDYVHIASHDLKTPLRSISGFSTLMSKLVMKKNKTLKDKETINEYCALINNSISKMNNTIEKNLENKLNI